ncbi:MAG: hypothetical protein Fur0011_2760 [Candidatus Microgenomates bacterium]
MPARFIAHTILLFAAVFGVLIWLLSPLEPYTLQLVGLLTLLYIGTHSLRRHYPKLFHKSSVTLDLTILTSMILLLVTETGALTSPLFFLLYFLLFATSMLYEIEATLVLTGVLILYFLFLPGTNLSDLMHLSQLGALIMITPLALFTGHQYEVNLEEKETRRRLIRHLSHQETDTLLFLSLNLKNTLITSLDRLSTIIPTTRIKEVHDNLSTLYKDLRALYKTSLDLEKAIDKETD